MFRYLKLFFRRIAKDLKQKELLPLKFLFFMHSSTILVLYPYLTIHMRELGINVEETAIMSAITPAVAILMPPIAGMIADKIGNFRVLLSSFSIVGGCSALLLLLVPVGRVTITFPDKLVYGLSCEPSHPPILSLYQEYPCTTDNTNTDNIIETDLVIESCGFACDGILNDTETEIFATVTNYEIGIYDLIKNESASFIYNITEADVYRPEDYSNFTYHKTLKNNERYKSAIRKLSKNSYYFPSPLLSTISCGVTNSSVSCALQTHERSLPQLSNKQQKNTLTVGMQLQAIEHDNFSETRMLYNVDYIKVEQKLDLTCTADRTEDAKEIFINTKIGDKNYLEFDNCSPRCIASTLRKKVCANAKTVYDLDMTVTFWSYLCVRVFVGIISGTSFAMFEGAVIALLREHKADYGLQRIYATIGGMISSPISGLMIDYASKGKGYTDFRPIFFLYAALKVISGLLMLFINLEFKKAAASVISDVVAVLKKLELIALFMSCVILGCAWGYIESFLFWLLDDLGGSKSLMGLTVTVGGCVGIPLLALSGPIVKRLGHANVIFIGFLFYAIRLLGYSLLYNPWLCLVFEAMESITFGLSFTAAVTYAAKLSTVTTDTSIQGMLGGLYYGVGKGVGSLIGGYLIEGVGIRKTFQLFAIATLLIGFIYLSFYHCYLKQHPSHGIDITRKDSEKPPKDLVASEGKCDVPVGFEDAMCNPAYETTEVEDEENNTTNENRNGYK